MLRLGLATLLSHGCSAIQLQGATRSTAVLGEGLTAGDVRDLNKYLHAGKVFSVLHYRGHITDLLLLTTENCRCSDARVVNL